MTFKFTDDNFNKEALESNVPVLVDFYADWCGPCKMMGPIVDELAVEYGDTFKIGKLNIDNDPDTAAKYRVMTIPTFLFIKDGEVVESVVGVVSKADMKAKLDSYK